MPRAGNIGLVLPANDPFPVGRRIRAALRLADIESFERLAEKVDTKNLGARTLRTIADDGDDSRVATRLDLIAISDVTGVPLAFFTLPADELLARLGEEQPEDYGEAIEALRADLAQLRLQVAQGALSHAAQVAEASPRTTEDAAPVVKRGRRRAGGAR